MTPASSVFALMRPACSRCGAAPVDWMSPAEARERSPRIFEAEAVVGPLAAAWHCRVCGEWGAFGSLESSDGPSF